MGTKGIRAIVGGAVRRLLGAAGATALVLLVVGASPALAAGVAYRVGPIREISSGFGGQNAEVEDAVDPTGKYVYVEWIGANGIGFARSTDRGAHFKRGILLPDSRGGWDPSVAVSSNGNVYAAFMVQRGTKAFPIVDSSFNDGASFPRATLLTPAQRGNWGDRDFIATGPGNIVYVTWDYGPSGSAIKLDCPPNGSCAITAGKLNIVMQVSIDGGNSFGPMTKVSPGFPASGADSAPLVIDPSGRVDVLFTRFRVTNRRSDKLGSGRTYFTSSADEGRTWTKPVMVGRSAGTISPFEWWIDGAIGNDAAGDLYATWDTQRRGADVGWLSYSTDHGLRWSAPIRVTPDHANYPHIVQAVGGPPGIAYVGWLSDGSPRGYGEYLRSFSIAKGWLSRPRQVSRRFGKRGVWPGDTFGIATLSPHTLVLSWGSATRGTRGNSEIYGTRVSVTLK